MANYYFPQLSTGAVAQYPFRRARITRTIANALPGGNLILTPDPDASRITWQLSYSNLSSQETNTLTAFFSNCQGRLRAFTFIDPAQNMLTSSSDLTNDRWLNSGSIHLKVNAPDPLGGTAAFLVTNTGQASQELAQTVAVPAGYQCCFSLYARSEQAASIELIRRGPSSQETTVVAVGPNWSRAISGGALSDEGIGITAAVALAPGQQVWLYGLNLEPQIQPSRYRPTQSNSGVYPNAHWAVDTLSIQATGPNMFGTTFTIEANL